MKSTIIKIFTGQIIDFSRIVCIGPPRIIDHQTMRPYMTFSITIDVEDNGNSYPEVSRHLGKFDISMSVARDEYEWADTKEEYRVGSNFKYRVISEKENQFSWEHGAELPLACLERAQKEVDLIIDQWKSVRSDMLSQDLGSTKC